MKQFLNNILFILYGIISLFILGAAIVFPFVLAIEEIPPYRLAWVIYPLTIVIMASQQQVFTYFDKLKNEKINRD